MAFLENPVPGIPRIRLEILGHGILACGSFREAGGTIWHLGGTSTPDTRYRRYWYAHFRFLIRFITPTARCAKTSYFENFSPKFLLKVYEQMPARCGGATGQVGDINFAFYAIRPSKVPKIRTKRYTAVDPSYVKSFGRVARKSVPVPPRALRTSVPGIRQV